MIGYYLVVSYNLGYRKQKSLGCKVSSVGLCRLHNAGAAQGLVPSQDTPADVDHDT